MEDWYSFTLSDASTTRGTSRIRIQLRNLTQNADLSLHNASGDVLSGCSGYCRSRNRGTTYEWLLRNFGEGTYYIRVAAVANAPVSYQLRYSNDSEVPGRSLASAIDLGDLTNVMDVRSLESRVHATGNDNCLFYERFYRFALSDAEATRDLSWVQADLRNLTQNADLSLHNASGDVLSGCSGYCRSRNRGTTYEWLQRNFGEGIYYIRVAAVANAPVSYQLRYSNNSEVPGRSFASAIDLGDLTNVADVRSLEGQVHLTGNENDLFYSRIYRFTVTEESWIFVELRNQTNNANLYLYDAAGDLIRDGCSGGGNTSRCRSENFGIADEGLQRTFGDGTYYIEVRAVANALISYQLRYGLAGG